MAAKANGGTRRRATAQVIERPRPARPAPHPVRIVPPAEAEVAARDATRGAGRIALSDGEAYGHYIVPIVATFACILLFLSAHGSVDAVDPNPAGARTSYAFAIGTAVLGVVGGVFLAFRNRPWAGLGALAGIPFAFWLKEEGAKIGGYWCDRYPAPTFFTRYPCDPGADISGTVWGLALAVLAGGGIVAGVLAGSKKMANAHAAFLAAGLGLLVAFGLASALLLPGLEERAAAAAELNRPVSIPGPGLALLAAAVAGAGLLARRLRR